MTMILQPWDRRDDESPEAFEAFVLYRNAGLVRNLRVVAETLGKDQSLISRWSARHEWIERTTEWDRHLDRHAQTVLKRDHIKSLGKVRELAAAYLSMYAGALKVDESILKEALTEIEKNPGRSPATFDKRRLAVGYNARAFEAMATLLLDIDSGKFSTSGPSDDPESSLGRPDVDVTSLLEVVNGLLEARGQRGVRPEDIIVALAKASVGKRRLGLDASRALDADVVGEDS